MSAIEQVSSILNNAVNLKHKAMLMLIYSSGLRVSELPKLKITDIVSSMMKVRIKSAKGNKDRYTILSHVCLKYLKLYWKKYRPDNWLFPGYNNNKLSTRAVQHAFHKAKKIGGVKIQGGVHTLRHSFATHMLETGSGIFQVQKMLGHKYLKTTLVYVHIQEENLQLQSPLDVYVKQNQFNNK